MNLYRDTFKYRLRDGRRERYCFESESSDRGVLQVKLSAWAHRFQGVLWGLGADSFLRQINSERELMKGRSEEWLSTQVEILRGRLVRGPAPCVELTARALGLLANIFEEKCQSSPSSGDLLMAAGMLSGRVVSHGSECDRGLSLCLASMVCALAGTSVHILCPSEARAIKLHTRFKDILHNLGISSSSIDPGDASDVRRIAWDADVVFAGVSVMMNEYMKDRRTSRLEGGRVSRLVKRVSSSDSSVADLRLKALEFVLLDDASSIMCDFNIRPFFLRDVERSEGERRDRELALRLAQELQGSADFRLDGPQLKAELTQKGEARLDAIQGIVSGQLARPLSRRRLVEEAIVASFLLQRERHYVVNDGTLSLKLEGEFVLGAKVKPAQSLLQMLEVKEGLSSKRQGRVGVRCTIGRFLRRYLAIGGATGSAVGLEKEMLEVFETPVVSVRKEGEATCDEVVLHLNSSERRAWLLDQLLRLRDSGEGAWVVYGTEQSRSNVVEASGAVGVALQEWSGDQGASGDFFLVSGNLNGDSVFPPEGQIVGPRVLLLVDCLDAQHTEQVLLDRLSPAVIRRSFSFDDELLQKFFPAWALRTAQWLSSKSLFFGQLLAKIGIRLLHRRAGSVRRRTRRAYDKAEKEEHRNLAFTGPPTA